MKRDHYTRWTVSRAKAMKEQDGSFSKDALAEYTSWLDRLRTEPTNKDVRAMLEDARQQAQQNSGERWAGFSIAVEDAMLALESGDMARVCFAFMELGLKGGEISNPTDEELDLIQNGPSALRINMERVKALREQSDRQRYLREKAQALAAYYWARDSHQTIRLSEMCQQVYADLWPYVEAGDMSGLLPAAADGLKEWLRPVAPEYARKGGRPKKGH